MKMHITEKALNEFVMPAGKAKMVVFDQEQPGFAVNITHKGTKSYVIVYRDTTGIQRQEKIADVGGVSANVARSLAKTRLDDIAVARGTTRAPRRKFCPTMDTFFFNNYLPMVKNKSRSHEAHLSIYRNHVQPVFENKRLDEVSSQDITAFNTILREKRVAGGRWQTQAEKCLADGTVKRTLILVRHIFNEAIRDEGIGIQKNPTYALQHITTRKVKGKFLTAEQLKVLVQAVKESENKDLYDIMRIMASTGLRRNNVLAMEWAWFDEARGTLTVPLEADKAKKGFVLHLPTGVKELLTERRKTAQGPWVFPNLETGKPYYSCRTAWVTARTRANLRELRMHDLRHTYASMMLDSGADIVDVQYALGHTQLKTTAVYLHLTEGRKRERANAAVQATGLFA